MTTKRASILCWTSALLAMASVASAQQGPGNAARLQLDQAYQLERQGKAAPALVCVNAAYRANPREFKKYDWHLAMRLCVAIRQFDDALRYARLAYALQPDADGLSQVIDVLIRREEFGPARLLLDQALQQHRVGRDPGWPDDRVADLAGVLYRSADANPYERDAADGQRYLQLATQRQKRQNHIQSTLALIRAYQEIGRYDEARKWLALWVKEGRPGNQETKEGFDKQLEDVGVVYDCITFRLSPDDERADVREWHQQIGGWDIMVPGKTVYRESAVLLTNAKSWTERSDRGETRWLHVVPLEAALPVGVSLVTKFVSTIPDLDAEAAADYAVPAPFRCFLDRSSDGQIDPTTPLARSIASSLKGATAVETFRRVWWWWTTNVEYAGVEGKEEWMDQSEFTLRQRQGVCHDMAQAACALLRANGLAARIVRGTGHTWAEVWFPRSGWLPFQNMVRLGGYLPLGGVHGGEEGAGPGLSVKAGWNAEKLWSTPGATRTRLALLTEDIPLEQVIRDAHLPGTLVK